MHRRDYKVAFRSEQSIAESTVSLRKRADVDHLARFDITKILQMLEESGVRGKGKLFIETLKEDEVDPYVTYKPLTLHISDETLQHARWGDPDSIYKVAHELGHIILHDHYAQAFSTDPSLRTKIAPQVEESAEWQANRFAYHFLLPDRFVRMLGDAKQIVEACGVGEEVARDRIDEIARKKKGSCIGETCPGCGNFSLRQDGIDLECDECGLTMSR